MMDGDKKHMSLKPNNVAATNKKLSRSKIDVDSKVGMSVSSLAAVQGSTKHLGVNDVVSKVKSQFAKVRAISTSKSRGATGTMRSLKAAGDVMAIDIESEDPEQDGDYGTNTVEEILTQRKSITPVGSNHGNKNSNSFKVKPKKDTKSRLARLINMTKTLRRKKTTLEVDPIEDADENDGDEQVNPMQFGRMSTMNKSQVGKSARTLLPAAFRRSTQNRAKRPSAKMSLTVKALKREPAPLLPNELEKYLTKQTIDRDQNGDNGLVLWLGEDFAAAILCGKCPPVAKMQRGELFQDILASGFIRDQEQKEEIEKMLGELFESVEGAGDNENEEDKLERKAKVESKVDEIENIVKNALCSERLYSSLLKQVIKKKLAQATKDHHSTLLVEHLTKIIEAINPKAVVYSGGEVFLEETAPAMFDVMTLEDMVSTNFSLSTLTNNTSGKIPLLKIHNDLNSADKYLFKDQTLKTLALYGFFPNGDPFDDEGEFSPESLFFKKFTAEVVDRFTVVFAGCSLKKTSPLSKLLYNINTPSREKNMVSASQFFRETYTDSSNARFLPRHFGLVTRITRSDEGNRHTADDINVNYTVFTPDETYSQVTGFLAFISSVKERSKAKAYVENAYTGLELFLTDLSQLLATSLSVGFFSSVGLPMFLDSPRTELDRNAELVKRLRNFAVAENEIKDAIQAFKTFLNKLESSINGDAIESRFLISKAVVENASKEANHLQLEQLQKLVNLTESSAGKRCSFRLFSGDDATIDEFCISYRAISKSSAASNVTLARFGANALVGNECNWIETETILAKERALLFEKIWGNAMSPSDSIEFVKNGLINLPKNAQETLKTKAKGQMGF